MQLLLARSRDDGAATGTGDGDDNDDDGDDVLPGPATKKRRRTTVALFDPPARAAAVLGATMAVNAVGEGRRRAARIMPRQLKRYRICYEFYGFMEVEDILL